MFTAGVRADDQVYVHAASPTKSYFTFLDGWIYFSVKNKQNKRSEAVEGRARRQLQFNRKTGQNPGKKIRRKISLKGRRGLSLQCSFPLNWSRCFEKGEKRASMLSRDTRWFVFFCFTFLWNRRIFECYPKEEAKREKAKAWSFCIYHS